MATLQLADRVKETSTTTGTGTFALLGAAAGFRAFSTFADADTVYYVIEAVDGDGVPTGQWEVGIGTIGAAGTTLARTTLISSSTGSAINFSAGTKNVFCDQPSSAILTVAAAAAAYQPLGSYAAASHTHTASQVTDLATAVVAFSNKTGAISQWTNDVGYLTSAGSGDVVGPASSVDNAIARMDGTTGKLLQGYTSGAPTISDTGVVTAPSLVTPIVIGGTTTTSTLTLRSTSGVGAAGADIIFQVGNDGATEAMRILNNGQVKFLDGSAGAPSLTFVGDAGAGFFQASSRVIVTRGSVPIMMWTSNPLIEMRSDANFAWSSNTAISSDPDLNLSRGAANTLYVGNGTVGDFTGTLIAGNIGLGTTTPDAPFDVSIGGFAATSTAGVIVQNETAATSGVPVQMSPRLMQMGRAWDTAASQTVAFFTEVLPATAATPTGTWKLGYSLNGAAASYPATISSLGGLVIGAVMSSGAITFTQATTAAELRGEDAILALAPGTTGQALLWNADRSAGVGFDVATNAILKIRTTALSAYATVDALGYNVSGAAGVSFGPSTVTSITVVNGIVTAIS